MGLPVVTEPWFCRCFYSYGCGLQHRTPVGLNPWVYWWLQNRGFCRCFIHKDVSCNTKHVLSLNRGFTRGYTAATCVRGSAPTLLRAFFKGSEVKIRFSFLERSSFLTDVFVEVSNPHEAIAAVLTAERPLSWNTDTVNIQPLPPE